MQFDFWPEEIKIRDKDRVDLHFISDWNKDKETDHVSRSWNFSDITEGKYFIYKTGAKNPHLPDEVGPIFPYLLNAHTNTIISPVWNDQQHSLSYPTWTLDIHGCRPNSSKGVAKRTRVGCHIVTALAFIKPNYPNQKIVAHLNEGKVENHYIWYNVDNLKWSTQKDNVRSRFHFSTGGLVS
jgi:hypothetical protein